MRSFTQNSGHFKFNNEIIPFLSSYSRYDKRYYLVDKSYYDVCLNMSKCIDMLQDEQGHYEYSSIKQIFPDTNFIGKMEICFNIKMKVDDVRDIKINSIFIKD